MKLIKPEPVKTVTIEMTTEELRKILELISYTTNEWFRENEITDLRDPIDKIFKDINIIFDKL